MRDCNICFDEEITKIIPDISPVPSLLCCLYSFQVASSKILGEV